MESREHRIVIVEDEGLFAADLRGRLEKAGYRVPAVADSGVEALEAIREKSPDLILMDIRLKGALDGIHIAEQVGRDFDIPVVYLTAYEDRTTLERASHTHAFGFIKKPITSASLQGTIEIALSKHRHEKYLREQRDWFSASFAAVPDAVVVTDGMGRISYINPVAEAMLGCKGDDRLGKPSAELLRFKGPKGSPVDDFVPAAMLHGAPVTLPRDSWLEGAKGRRIAVDAIFAPRLRDGRPDGVVIVFKDVTLRRFEDAQSRQEDRHDAVTRQAGGIAGQLDFELSVLAEESVALLKSLPQGNPLRAAAERIENATREAHAVTRRLNAFASEREIKPHVVRVQDVLEAAAARWQGALPGLCLGLESDLRPVHADPSELARILDMLLQHAHRRRDGQGDVRAVACGSEADGLEEWIRIEVSYTSSEDSTVLERVFDASWDGNWEGLPFAFGITKRMGGFMRARMAGHRSVFEVFLPSVEVEAAGAAMEIEERPALLVIERNSAVRRMLHAHFDLHGYTVLEAGDCEEALVLAESFDLPIRLAIANPAMDDKLRSELTARLMEVKPGICVRVIGGDRCYLTKRELLDWANQALGSSGVSMAAALRG